MNTVDYSVLDNPEASARAEGGFFPPDARLDRNAPRSGGLWGDRCRWDHAVVPFFRGGA